MYYYIILYYIVEYKSWPRATCGSRLPEPGGRGTATRSRPNIVIMILLLLIIIIRRRRRRKRRQIMIIIFVIIIRFITILLIIRLMIIVFAGQEERQGQRPCRGLGPADRLKTLWYIL